MMIAFFLLLLDRRRVVDSLDQACLKRCPKDRNHCMTVAKLELILAGAKKKKKKKNLNISELPGPAGLIFTVLFCDFAIVCE